MSSNDTAAPTTTEKPVDAEAQAKLLRFLPPGYPPKRGVSVVTCPGNIQSPGPWRRNATPQQVSGTLVCGVQQDRPTLAWTDDIALLLGVVRADDKGPTMDRLYAWWSSHS